MEENVEVIYQKLADVIGKSIEADWNKAWITAKVLDNFSEAEYDYQLADGSENWFDPGFENNMVIVDSLQKLRKLMKQSGMETWNRIIFTLTADGKFNIDMSYKD